MIYSNVFTMLDSMKAHHAQHGHRLRCSDDPMRRTLGFCTDVGPVEEWQLTITGLKESLISGDPRVPLLRELLPSTEGRQRLVDSINQGYPLI